MALSGSIKTNSYDGRYYKLEWTATQSIVSNTTTISWTISCSGGSANWYAERDLRAVIDGVAVYSKYSRVERKKGTIKTGTTVLQHDTYGIKNGVEMSLKVACYTSTVNLKASKTYDLDAIPRMATIVSAPNFTDEENPTITYSNPIGEEAEALQVCISFDKTAQNIAYRDVSKTGSTYTFNFTDAERAVLYNGTTTANSRTVYFYIKTTIGGETFYNSLAKTLTIANCMPTINPEVYDSETIDIYNQEPYNPTGDTNTYFIKGWSDATYDFKAQTKKGATITSYSIKCGNKTGNTATGTIENVESATFEFVATDSRGNKVSKTITKTLIDYFKPTLNLEVSPPTAQGSMVVKVSGKFFNGMIGNTKNTFQTFNITYEEDGVIIKQFEIENSISINGNNYSYEFTIPNLNYRATYDVYAICYDILRTDGHTTTNKRVKLLPVFDWGKDDFKFNVPVSGLEGEWIPTLNSSAISSYTNQKGWYIKSGDVVNAGFYIKATCNSGKESTSISIGGLPFKPAWASAGGGLCSGCYVSSGFTFQCWVAGTDGNITARVQQVNHTTATNLATSASGCFYRENGGEITISGTITYITT